MSIPQLGVERLIQVHKVQLRKRKETGIHNDHVRDVFTIYNNSMTRQATNYDLKIRRGKIPVQQKLEDLLCYRKALDAVGLKHETSSLCEFSPFGLYRGITKRDLKEEIEVVRTKNRPEYRRKKETAALLREGSRAGKIIDQDSVSDKFEFIFEKKYDRDNGRLVSRLSRGTGTDSRAIILPPLPVTRRMMANKSPMKMADDKIGMNRSSTESDM